MIDAFVLFDDADRLVASRLTTALLERDVVCSSGQDAAKARSARSIVVCWSPRAVGNAALVRIAKTARTGGRLLQAKVKACDVPAAFGQTDGALLEGWDGSAADLRFQQILQGVRALNADTARRRPHGLGWRDRFARRPLAWCLAAVTGLAGVIGVAINLNTGKDWACQSSPLHERCRAWGWVGPAPESILSRVEGTWSPDQCRTVRFTLKTSDDGRTLKLIYPGRQDAIATVTGVTDNAVMIDYPSPTGNGVETARLERQGEMLRMSMPNSVGFKPTEWGPCKS